MWKVVKLTGAIYCNQLAISSSLKLPPLMGLEPLMGLDPLMGLEPKPTAWEFDHPFNIIPVNLGLLSESQLNVAYVTGYISYNLQHYLSGILYKVISLIWNVRSPAW